MHPPTYRGRSRRQAIAVLLLPFAVSAVLLLSAGLLMLIGLLWLGIGLMGTPSAYGAAATAGGAGLWLAGAVARAWQPVAAVVHVLPAGSQQVLAAGAQGMGLGSSVMAAAGAIPTAVGADGPRRYVIAALNSAETFGSGGALLHAVLVEFRDGTPRLVLSAPVNDSLTGGRALTWQPVGGAPWYQPGGPHYLATTTVHPHFPLAGEDVLRAWESAGQGPVDGVLAVDPTALAAVLARLGPVAGGAHGTVTAENLAQEVLVDAYRRFPETTPEGNATRRAGNEALARGVAAEVLAAPPWRSLPADPVALLRGRHVQVYLRDQRLAPLVARLHADGALPAGEQHTDLLGAFSQSGATKLDLFQQRRITQQVLVRPDGSAAVTRVIDTTNAVPPGLTGDPDATRGYLALSVESRLAHRVPAGAGSAGVRTGPQAPLVAPADTGPYPDGAGGEVLWQGQVLAPGSSAAAVVRYDLPAGTFRAPTGAVRYRLLASPQPMPQAVVLRVEVRGKGLAAAPPEGWQLLPDGTAEWSGTLDQPIDLDLPLHPRQSD